MNACGPHGFSTSFTVLPLPLFSLSIPRRSRTSFALEKSAGMMLAQLQSRRAYAYLLAVFRQDYYAQITANEHNMLGWLLSPRLLGGSCRAESVQDRICDKGKPV